MADIDNLGMHQIKILPGSTSERIDFMLTSPKRNDPFLGTLINDLEPVLWDSATGSVVDKQITKTLLSHLTLIDQDGSVDNLEGGAKPSPEVLQDVWRRGVEAGHQCSPSMLGFVIMQGPDFIAKHFQPKGV